ncbi:glycosyltransferase family 2 protein [Escherichia albertii]|uniref:glycosyltransferase family 2 protein n=1 Tax=Escherichia albertii TaxID=208962 RepID=UPI001984F50F|nr:glycosyltransferase family 2 protein [Escherichia albertii]MCI5279468.1 glycosyltransferase [Escherichia albertii]MCZ8663549.1 glycosyltransferase family 2 protein [Escherichia albertii]MCZ8706953.1 glycosyltransferase family 2 protein [Escherichia albertii]MCZ9012988.1 glycosyltransferase family 2 protein [Escherichia albertii]HCZ5334897.1 glycosyltransferase [Escherichia albertii]
MTNDIITIITINYNNAEGLAKTIASIDKQTNKEFEYLIIDGGSDDNSVEHAKKSVMCSRIISEKDNGIYDAMNKGAYLAKGEYIIFINSGDELRKNSIENFMNILCNTKSVYDIYHGILAFKKNGEVIYYRGRRNNLLTRSMIEHPTVLMRKSTFIELKGFDLQWRYVADYELMLRAYLAKKRFFFVEEIIADFDISGVSSVNIKAPLESLLLQRKYNLINSFEYFCKCFLLKMKEVVSCLR